MTIRCTTIADIPTLMDLLQQVLYVHHVARPDLSQEKGVRHAEGELVTFIADDNRPIFVYGDGNGRVLAHMFIIVEDVSAPKVPQKTLFIDDLCVDEAVRGQRIGEKLYQFALKCAKEISCYNLALNIWSINKSAVRFCGRRGMTPQETYVERIID